MRPHEPLVREVLADEGFSFPDEPLLLYNLACYESLDGRRDAALVHLKQALSADPTMRETTRADSDFARIADEPEFRALVES